MAKVYLIGAGPGDSDLITLRGKRIIEKADCIIYDSLISDEILDFAKKDAEKIYVGKRMGKHSAKQDEINEILIDAAQKYHTVVRLKGGDPFVFGRGGEEVRALIAHGISFELIPGITSAVAVPELAGIPVTDRGVARSFHVFTGHTKDSANDLPFDFNTLTKLNGTLIFLMGLHNLGVIVNGLISGGMSEATPCAVISDGACAFTKTVRGTLSDIEEKVKKYQISSPAIIVIGETAGYVFLSNISYYSEVTTAKSNIESSLLISDEENTEEKIGKVSKGIPELTKIDRLAGIVATERFAERLSSELEKYDITPVHLCRMEVVEQPDISKLDDIFSNDDFQYDWIVFTSQNAVTLFFERAKKNNFDFRRFSKAKFAIIGTGTEKALNEYGFQADFEPEEYTTEMLAKLLMENVSATEKVMIPRALRGTKDFTERLSEANITFDEFHIYDVCGRLYNASQRLEELPCITFASRSGAEEFLYLCEENNIEIPRDMKFVCIGSGAADFLESKGFSSVITADVHSAEGLGKTVAEIFTK